jgi:glycosyltransferase involved in cell wall biosynthesis
LGKTETISVTLDSEINDNSTIGSLLNGMPHTPTVSVVMPVFNGAEFLDEAVRSILDQTFRDFEFIIVDDGSTDDTPRILRKYAEADDRVRVHRQENRGVVAALNQACRLAQGRFIARMDADDVSLPRRFEKQIEFLKTHPKVGVLGTWASKIDKQGSVIATWCLPANPTVLKWNHFFRVCVIHPTVLMRREILEKLNFYRPDAVYAEDWDLWLRASAITEFGNTPEILFKYRISGKNTSKRLGQMYRETPTKLLVPFISDFLKESPSIEAVAGLRETKLASLEQIHSTTALLEKLYYRFVTEHPLATEELKEISWDAAKKMGCLALQALRFSGLEFLLLFNRALRLNYRLLSPAAILTGLERRRSWHLAK